jgi:thiol-disulfide isomerase/thioredoxin
MNKILIGVFIGGVVIVGGFIFFQSGGSNGTIFIEENNTSTPQEQRQIPNVVFEDYDGNPVALEDFIGTPLVVNSWAKWCPFCVDELPDFVTVQEEVGDQVIFIAIDRAEPLSVAKKFTDDLGITNKLVFLLDPGDEFYRAIGGFAMPETIFVDAKGNIQFQKKGVMSIEEIRQRTQELL